MSRWLRPASGAEIVGSSRSSISTRQTNGGNSERRADLSFDDQRRLLIMFATASRVFKVPVWFATLPHRQVFDGEYIAKAFKSRADFDYDVNRRKAVNAVTRDIAAKEGVPLFDLKSDLASRTDIFMICFTSMRSAARWSRGA